MNYHIINFQIEFREMGRVQNIQLSKFDNKKYIYNRDVVERKSPSERLVTLVLDRSFVYRNECIN